MGLLPRIGDENIGAEYTSIEGDYDVDWRDEVGEVGAGHDEESDDGEGEDVRVTLGVDEPI